MGVRRRHHETGTGTGGSPGIEKSAGPYSEPYPPKESRAKLAIVFGGIAMALILLSEWIPAQPDADARTAAADPAAYRVQIEQQLTSLIEQIDGAGKTVVMLTLENGEETVYALDTQSGQTQSQETHVLLDDGPRWRRRSTCRRSAVRPLCARAAAMSRVAVRITELVSALLDLPSNRICVEQRKG